MDIRSPSDKITVLIPKTSFGEDGRNSLVNLFNQAGYDNIVDGDFGRNDEMIAKGEKFTVNREEGPVIEQGDFLFRLTKGPGRLAAQLWLFREKTIGLIAAGNDLAEAQAINLDRRQMYTNTKMVLHLGVGKCSLEFLAPEENPIATQEDLKGREIFTQYPTLAERMLASWGIKADIFEGRGADTTMADFRAEGADNLAALEIVGTGGTAKRNRLVRSTVTPCFSDFDFTNVATDMYVTNVRQISDYVRGALLTLGDALESALQKNEYSVVNFNIPAMRIGEFRDFGITGPTAAGIVSKNEDAPWMALEVFVPDNEANATVTLLKQMGAKGVGITERHVAAGQSADASEAFSNLGTFIEEPTTTK